MLLDVFVADDWLDRSVRVVYQELINSFKRHFGLLVVIVRVQAENRLVVFGCTGWVFGGVFC